MRPSLVSTPTAVSRRALVWKKPVELESLIGVMGAEARRCVKKRRVYLFHW